MPTQELISQREYARRKGISNVAVNRAVKAGRITLVDGKIDPVLADRQWAENTDPSTPKNSITGKPKQVRGKDEVSKPMDLGEETSTSPSYAKARAAREVYNAQNAKLDLDLKRGTLVKADEVKIAAFNMARKTRDQLIALPERLSTILAATEEAGEVHKILEEEIERICLEIADAERS